MTKLFEKPYLIFFLSIPIIILIGILGGEELLDINIHDTYYVFTYGHLAILISILFGIIGIGYWIMKKTERKLLKGLTWTHTGLTFGGSLVVWILNKFYRTEFLEYGFNDKLTLLT